MTIRGDRPVPRARAGLLAARRISLPSAAAVLAARVALIPALAAVLHFAVATDALLLKDPPIWPDESLFANPAIHLLEKGNLGTDLLSGLVPGIDRRTYWVPPLHILAAAGVFKIAGVGALQLRLISIAAAVLVLALTYHLARRVGMGRFASSLCFSALCVDSLFLRGSRIGRMDMLALLLVLASICLTLRSEDAPRGPARFARPLLGGLAAGLAALTHPFGAVAAGSLAAGLAIAPAGQRSEIARFALGFALPLVPYGIYVLGDPPSFWMQMQYQILRKGSRPPLDLSSLADSLLANLHAYGRARSAARLFWISGAAGIALLVLRNRRVRPLLFVFIASVLFVLLGREMWYPLYLLPFLALGVLALGTARPRRRFFRRIPPIVAALLLVWFARENLVQQRRLDRKWNDALASRSDYTRFCQQIAAALPGEATVVLALIPDPYLGLRGRPGLKLRSFAPDEMPIPPATWSRFLGEADYVILGNGTPSRFAGQYAEANGRLAASVDDPLTGGYQARIYRISPGPEGDREAPKEGEDRGRPGADGPRATPDDGS